MLLFSRRIAQRKGRMFFSLLYVHTKKPKQFVLLFVTSAVLFSGCSQVVLFNLSCCVDTTSPIRFTASFSALIYCRFVVGVAVAAS